jgi:hypothetical protein
MLHSLLPRTFYEKEKVKISDRIQKLEIEVSELIGALAAKTGIICIT